MTVIKTLKKSLRGKSIRHKRWNMNKVKRLIDCPNCGKQFLSGKENTELTPDEAEKLKKVVVLLKSSKDPYKKKLELFKLIKELEVEELKPEKKERINYLLQSRLYHELAKQSMKDYKRTTAEEFVKG